MLNIQFMTKEANGVETGACRGIEYYPNYEALLENATCEEEREAIKKSMELKEKGFGGFAFEIVYTAKALHVDPWTCKHSLKWQVMQQPWYHDQYGTKASKADMIAEIEARLEAEQERWG